jgi:hypothetical protein
LLGYEAGVDALDPGVAEYLEQVLTGVDGHG